VGERGSGSGGEGRGGGGGGGGEGGAGGGEGGWGGWVVKGWWGGGGDLAFCLSSFRSSSSRWGKKNKTGGEEDEPGVRERTTY